MLLLLFAGKREKLLLCLLPVLCRIFALGMACMRCVMPAHMATWNWR